MIRRKIESKRFFFALLFIIIIFISNGLIFSGSNQFPGETSTNSNKDNKYTESLKISDVGDNITGTGTNQDVRIYSSNTSVNLNDNQEYFEIPSSNSDEMYLTYGSFNFTFQNNYTTDYIIEDDHALYDINSFISYGFNSYSNVTFTNGTILGGVFSDFTDGSNSSFIRVSSSLNGLLNFTVKANFTDITYLNGVNVEFNRSNILGLILSMVYRLEFDANLTVQIKDSSLSSWTDIITGIFINSSLGIQEIRERIINENLNYTDSLNCSYVRFIFERWDTNPFIAWLYNFDLISTHAFDLPITDTSYVGLEFDLKGLNSTINGFSAWIRTIDISEAAKTQLNITLYRANSTIVRSDDTLRKNNLVPDYNEMIDSIIVNYTSDKLSYFAFNIDNTTQLNVSNYFIIIKSNSSSDVYRLVTIPYLDYGDDRQTEHQLKTTLDKGISWSNAKKTISPSYDSTQLDASSFKLNVTRGYMPLDFIVNGTNTLRIQNLTINNQIISIFPYNESSYLTWGFGQWNYNFTTPLGDNGTNKFRVNLTWDKSIINSFKFNVSYSVNAYWFENATTTYTANYNEDPLWNYAYDLNKTSQKFKNWTYREFWFLYPDYMTAKNLTDPNSVQILKLTGGQRNLTEISSKYKIIVNFTSDGIYSLNLTSFNFLYDLHSYINYNGTLWETPGFMYGDNISTSLEIQDHKLKAPTSGIANVSLYYPNGSAYINAELTSSVGTIKDLLLRYDFNNRTVINLTNQLDIFGEYSLGFFWFNGSAIGSKKITIYIDTYDVDLYGLNYDSNLKKNILDGEIKNPVFDNYTILVASINKTTGVSLPNFYPINNGNLTEQFDQEIGGERLPVQISTFKQSENILNPNESVRIKTSIQNLHSFIPVNVKINLKLVSYANEDWIIAENTSSSALLNFTGLPDDTFEFDLNLKIPDLNIGSQIWAGLNAPIRLAGAKTLITVFIENMEAGTYESTEYSLLSNKTEGDFEGYIMGLKTTEFMTSRSLLLEFFRDECSYFPSNTTFLVNIFDQNYLSSYHQFDNEFSLKINSRFTNLTINPDNPIEGHIFNLSAILSTEFDENLINKNVSSEYYYESSWFTIGSDFTNSNGAITFLINTLNVDYEADLIIRLLWEGDDIIGAVRNISISLIPETNNLSISITNNDVQTYANTDTLFTIVINNIGSSILRITNVSIELNPTFQFKIVEINYLLQNWLTPGEFTIMTVKVELGNVNSLDLNIVITAQNLITNETLSVSKEKSIVIFQAPITEYFFDFFPLIVGLVIGFIWIAAFLYSRRTSKRIQTPIEERVKKRPRRGKYVPVSELKKPTPIKKMSKKLEVPKETQQKETMDLDSLLEERGLGETKKKKQQVKKPIKKIAKKKKKERQDKKEKPEKGASSD